MKFEKLDAKAMMNMKASLEAAGAAQAKRFDAPACLVVLFDDEGNAACNLVCDDSVRESMREHLADAFAHLHEEYSGDPEKAELQ